MKNFITSIMLAFSVYGYSQTEKETDSIVETTITANSSDIDHPIPV